MPSLWADEGATISAVDRPLPDLWRLVQNIDAVHAVYYVLMHGWAQVFGVDQFWLRLPSAVAVAACTVALHRLALRLLAPMPALLTTITFVALPRVTWMGIEARSSAFSSLVAILATLVLVVSWQSRRLALVVGYAVLIAVGVGLHIYLAMLPLAHLTYLLLCRAGRGTVRRWVTAAIAGVAFASPVVLLSMGQASQVGGGTQVELLTGLRQMIANQYFLGERPLETGDLIADLWRFAAIALTFVCAAIVGVGWWWSRGTGQPPAVALWLGLTWGFLPSVIVLAGSIALGHNLYHPRYFAFGAAGLALSLGWALERLGRRCCQLVAVGLVVLLAVPVYVSQRGVSAKTGADWSQLVANVDSQADAGDGVYYSFTNRIIAIAYPGRLDRLQDLTLVRDRISDASLVGESRPLAVALAKNRPSRVWAVYRLDRPDRAADERAFRAAGYTAAAEWRGTWDEVVEYVML